MAAGVPPHRFWDYTYRELYAVFAAIGVRERRERKVLIWAAHANAIWGRTKKVPSLSSIIRRLDPPRPMSPKAIRASIMAIAKAMGAAVVYRKKGS